MAKELVLKKSFLDVTELIRSIQRAEGNPDCFRRAKGHCDRLDCAWKEYCQEKPKDIASQRGESGKEVF